MILALPVVGVVVVFVLYAAMFGLGLFGRVASGPKAELVFVGCPAARPFIEARLLDMGLQDAVWSDRPDGFSVLLTQVGDPEVDARMPHTLSMPGVLEVRGGEAVLATNADVIDASVRLDLLMTPSVLLDLEEPAAFRVRDHVRSDPGGRLVFRVDGTDIGSQSNTNPVAVGQVEIASTDFANDREQMHAVAAWSVVLDHGPLPCAVSVAADSR